MIYDWRVAVLVGFLTMTTVELGRRRAPVRVAFNTGLYTLAAGAAGATAAAVPGESLLVRCIAALVTTTAFYLVNICLLGTLIARLELTREPSRGSRGVQPRLPRAVLSRARRCVVPAGW